MIRRITTSANTTTVVTFAGTIGSPGFADGSGTDARFRTPQALSIDSAGVVYVADTGNHTIRKLTTGTGGIVNLGVATTLGGVPGSNGNVDAVGQAARFFRKALR